MICFGILVMFCQVEKAPAVDSYCAAYQKVIRAAGEGAIKATPEVKRRIAANEILYRCTCEGWKSPLCPQEQK